jgi:hypothetical protein
MVVFDASFVLRLIEPDAPPPKDPTTGRPVEKCKDRIEYLVAELARAKVVVAVPTPALAEFLVRAGAAAARYLEELQNTRAIRVEPFGQRAAVECAMLIDGAKRARRKTRDEDVWAKVKFDRQILAVAKVLGASALYTTDAALAALAAQNDVRAIGVHELELPPVDPQIPLLPPQSEGGSGR